VPPLGELEDPPVELPVLEVLLLAPLVVPELLPDVELLPVLLLLPAEPPVVAEVLLLPVAFDLVPVDVELLVDDVVLLVDDIALPVEVIDVALLELTLPPVAAIASIALGGWNTVP
jgi:hypothetical protein